MLPVKTRLADGADARYQVEVVDEAARPLPAGTMGSIVIKLPMPPACLPTLWEQDARWQGTYSSANSPGYYKTSDAGYKDEDGYVYVWAAPDDIINVAGTGSPPAVWRKSGLASRRRRMRGARHQGRHQGRGAVRLCGG